MKRKALIVGALPSPFEGPWVVTDDAEAWRVVSGGDYREHVQVEFPDGSRAVVDSRDLILTGTDRVRGLIVKSVPNVPHVSVWIEALRKQ